MFHGDISIHMGAALLAGTTFTMAMLYGKLLTVANVGDSKAFIDTGSEIVEVSTSHRIEDNIGKPPTLEPLCLMSPCVCPLSVSHCISKPASQIACPSRHSSTLTSRRQCPSCSLLHAQNDLKGPSCGLVRPALSKNAWCAGERMRLSAAGARVARMHHTDFKAPAPEGEKGIGKLRVWERNGLGRLRVSRAIGKE
jgi:hypothetical protein